MKLLGQLIVTLLLSACVNAPEARGLVEVSVYDRTSGEQLKLHRHDGKLYVAGRPGNKYAVALHNKTAGRALTVVSVDGVNAITGETAAVQQSGYVLDANASAEIAGWRKSLSEIAAFVFTSLPDSYAARTGRPENVGVIGVAVFREYVPPLPESSTAPLSDRRAAAESAGSADATKARRSEQKLGTGHGQRETSHVRYTEFRRASEQPAEVIRIYYDSYANLVARGVIVMPASDPNPFPGRFVPDPRG